MRYPIISSIMAIMVLAVPAFGRSRLPLSGDVELEIVEDNGSGFRSIPLQTLRSGQTQVFKRYLEARKGANYGIMVRNRSDERIGLVIAVDGRNIITGKQSGLKSGEMMYILGPFEEGRFDGWRTSASEVHRFYFTEPADSYSMRTFEDASAMGVIAVAVFREKELPPSPPQSLRRDAPAAPSAESARRSEKALAEERAGTGFGDSSYSPVVTVAFEPERMPVRKLLVKYEWTETLCRKGLLACGREPANRLWDGEGYAPYPPSYGRN